MRNRLTGPVARQMALWILGGFAVGWLVSVFWWALLEPTTAEHADEIVIPPGAAELIAQGRRVPGVPTVIRGGRTGTVRITNNDSVEHYLAGALIRPGATAEVRPAQSDGQVTCSFHVGGVIGYQLDKRPPITVTFIPAAALGVPFGIAFGVATIVARRIGDDAPEPSAA
jgi:hypothetical protein